MGASWLMKETAPVISEEMKEGHLGLPLSWSAANLNSEKQILHGKSLINTTISKLERKRERGVSKNADLT